MLPVPFCPLHILRETTGAALHKHPATGGRLIRHARYYWLILAESHLTRRLFGSMVRRIGALPAPTG